MIATRPDAELKRVQAIIDRMHVVKDSGEELDDELSGSFKSSMSWNLAERRKVCRYLIYPNHICRCNRSADMEK
jgi:hypothetical protein